MPLFSVIVPAYNAMEYLSACLASVADQTYRDFELVVVDDGSTDDTPAILECHARNQGQFPVILLRQENRGRLSARRVGLKRATGDYVVFLDADDTLRQDALEVLAAEVERTHVDVVVFGMSNEPDFSRPQFAKGLPFGLFEGGEYQRALRCVARGACNTLWGKAIRLIAFDRDADYAPFEGLMHGEDLFQLLPVMNRAQSCSHIPEALYFYRRHEGASTMSFRPKQLDDIEVVLGRLLAYGERWGLVGDAAYGSLRNFCSVAKILVNDPAAKEIRDVELDRMGAALIELGLERLLVSAGMRPDDRLLLHAILAGRHREVVALVKAVELAKRIGGELGGGW